jgi:predicted TIM-barrel enzyme
VLAGVCGTDPFRLMPVFLKQAKAMGFALGVEMIRLARECNLLTSPYCFDPESARAMAAAGADVLVPHVGLTTKGSIGATTAVSLDEAPALVQAMHDAAKDVNPDIIVLCHGGPIAEPPMPNTCLRTRMAWSASTEHRAWSSCRPRSRSARTPDDSRSCRSTAHDDG